MSKLDHFWLIHTTSTREDADTDDSFHIDVLRANGDLAEAYVLPNLDHNDRQRGRTDQYRINVKPGDLPTQGIELWDSKDFRLRISGNDAWLPSSLWIIGQAEDRTLRLLVGVPSWPSQMWFSSDPSEGKKEYRLSEVGARLTS